jgi:hypothetical protein
MPIGNPIGLAQAVRGKKEAAKAPAPTAPVAARKLRLDTEFFIVSP